MTARATCTFEAEKAEEKATEDKSAAAKPKKEKEGSYAVATCFGWVRA